VRALTTLFDRHAVMPYDIERLKINTLREATDTERVEATRNADAV
jgi:hypothetical protein